jgi:signal recognition particle subunit SRP54
VETADAALSIKSVVNKPIKFIGTGEKMEALDVFHPDRMASRILGMGDMLTLIEQAEQAFEKDAAEEAAAKLLDGDFTLDDFLEQMQSLKKMGPLGGLMGMMPGMPKELKNAKIGDDELKPVEAIIRSMTKEERRKPEIINGSRRQRIATGSGRSIAEVNRLVKQFGEMQKMMKRMGGMTTGKKGKRKMSSMAGLGALGAAGVPGQGGGFGDGLGGGAPGGGFPGFPPSR